PPGRFVVTLRTLPPGSGFAASALQACRRGASCPLMPSRSRVPLQRDAGVLDLRARDVLVDRLLAPDSRLLVSADRHADVMRARVVDPDVAGLDAGREAVRAIEVVRPDRGGEAIVERIDARDHVVLVGPAQDADHRSEDLLACD